MSDNGNEVVIQEGSTHTYQDQDNNNNVRNNNNGANDVRRNTNQNDFPANGFNSTSRSFEGKNKDIGGVLGLRNERLDKKVSFDTFRELLTNYVMTHLDNADDVVAIVCDLEDLQDKLKKHA